MWNARLAMRYEDRIIFKSKSIFMEDRIVGPPLLSGSGERRMTKPLPGSAACPPALPVRPDPHVQQGWVVRHSHASADPSLQRRPTGLRRARGIGNDRSRDRRWMGRVRRSSRAVRIRPNGAAGPSPTAYRRAAAAGDRRPKRPRARGSLIERVALRRAVVAGSARSIGIVDKRGRRPRVAAGRTMVPPANPAGTVRLDLLRRLDEYRPGPRQVQCVPHLHQGFRQGRDMRLAVERRGGDAQALGAAGTVG